MEKKYITQKLIIKIVIVLLAIQCIFFAVAKHQIQYKQYNQVVEQNSGNVGSIINESTIQQTFIYSGDYISKILIKVGTYQRQNKGFLNIKLVEVQTGKEIYTKSQDISKLEDNSDMVLNVNSSLSNKNGQYRLEITDSGLKEDNAITLYYNNSSIHHGSLYVNGVDIKNELEMSIYGDNRRKLGNAYWLIVLVFDIAVVLVCEYQRTKEIKGRKGFLHSFLEIINTYKFMGKQLISRDFKTKYKRSVLGMLWSLLNPLLTMAVQYVVFSTIFRSNIDNYPVYLLSASILFNFFTESVGGGLVSIVGNGSLIKKVNAPKYIYPITKVLSTGINLLISLIPLLVVVLITGEKISISYVLIPFALICLLIFCFGMSLILSSLMVYFRDVQFLWGILSLLWMYATPMFYPASIIPDRFKFVLTWNPMYHYITFFRTIILEATSPQLYEYVWCMVSSIFILIIGMLIFKKLEKKFILYL